MDLKTQMTAVMEYCKFFHIKKKKSQYFYFYEKQNQMKLSQEAEYVKLQELMSSLLWELVLLGFPLPTQYLARPTVLNEKKRQERMQRWYCATTCRLTMAAGAQASVTGSEVGRLPMELGFANNWTCSCLLCCRGNRLDSESGEGL